MISRKNIFGYPTTYLYVTVCLSLEINVRVTLVARVVENRQASATGSLVFCTYGRHLSTRLSCACDRNELWK